MAGTILKQLTAVAQADGTAQTFGPGNSGWSSATVGAGNTATHENDAKMAEVAGYRLTQSGANSAIQYLDLDTGQTILAWRIPFKFQMAATPVTFTVGRFYATGDSGHVTNMGSFSITSTRRLQFLEAGTGGLNVTSPSGTPMANATDYVMMGLINVTANTVEINVYPLGSTTALLTVSGNLAADMAAAAGLQYFRWSIGTASALVGGYLDTNSGFALGSGDWLDRTDVTNTPPTANAGADITVDADASFTLTGTAGDADGTVASTRWLDGATELATGLTYNGTSPATLSGTTKTYTFEVTDNLGAVTTDTVVVTVNPAATRLSDGVSVKAAVSRIF